MHLYYFVVVYVHQSHFQYTYLHTYGRTPYSSRTRFHQSPQCPILKPLRSRQP
ncbi:hypothetical protein IQ07DRAFT_50387 [Pyrenochaeta sp. DS3sAY3a]|nr:hypothetical protein IQ07DRAFT_50387 [Pyrenochaeta sp. DS3sAY3a]